MWGLTINDKHTFDDFGALLSELHTGSAGAAALHHRYSRC